MSVGRGGIAVGGGLGTVILVLLVMFLGGDPRAVLEQAQQAPPPQAKPGVIHPEQEQLKEFVSVVLADTEDVWHKLFREQGKTYREPTLVLFSDAVESACGYASAAAGPRNAKASSSKSPIRSCRIGNMAISAAYVVLNWPASR